MSARNTLRIALIWLAALTAGAAVIDRIAVIVGDRVIKLSDLDRDIRLTDFLNRAPVDLSAKAKRDAAGRLVDQDLIRDEIVTGNYRRAADSEADAVQAQLVHDRFRGSETEFQKALAQYGLTAEQLHAQLLWQLTVLQFVDERFRIGVHVTDDEVEQYYKQHEAELKKQNPGASTETLQSAGREVLEGTEVNKNFEDWLDRARKRTRIEYKEAAFT